MINLDIIGNTFINIFIIPVDFGLFAIAESISIVNNRKKYSAKWDRGLTVQPFHRYGHRTSIPPPPFCPDKNTKLTKVWSSCVNFNIQTKKKMYQTRVWFHNRFLIQNRNIKSYYPIFVASCMKGIKLTLGIDWMAIVVFRFIAAGTTYKWAWLPDYRDTTNCHAMRAVIDWFIKSPWVWLFNDTVKSV